MAPIRSLLLHEIDLFLDSLHEVREGPPAHLPYTAASPKVAARRGQTLEQIVPLATDADRRVCLYMFSHEASRIPTQPLVAYVTSTPRAPPTRPSSRQSSPSGTRPSSARSAMRYAVLAYSPAGADVLPLPASSPLSRAGAFLRTGRPPCPSTSLFST